MIRVLQRAAAVLRAVASESGPSFTDIRRATRLNKATLSRILGTLEDLGFVERRSDRSYGVGPFIVQLARAVLKREALSRVSEVHARALAEQLRELVTVGTIRNGRRYNLAKATVERSIIVDAEPHLRPSAYNTATGRAMLAELNAEDLDHAVRIHGLPEDAWPGVSTRDELEEELERIRRAGCATHVAPDGEAEALAVPVFGPDGRAWAAVGASLPRYRLDHERRTEVLDALRNAAEAMRQELTLELGGSAEVGAA